MGTGKLLEGGYSPIIHAISDAEAGTTAEIRVHLCKRLFEKDPFRRAQRLFIEHEMFRTSQRNAVLIYINLHKKCFAIVADVGIDKILGQAFWRTLSQELAQNLRSTHYERAIAQTIQSLGIQVKKHYPAGLERF